MVLEIYDYSLAMIPNIVFQRGGPKIKSLKIELFIVNRGRHERQDEMRKKKLYRTKVPKTQIPVQTRIQDV